MSTPSCDQVKQKALELGFHAVGIAAASEDSGAGVAALQDWLNRGYQAEMAWMTSPKRQDIRQVMPQVRSIICVALNYYTGHQRPDGKQYAKIARYGWGRDYHRVMTTRLKALSAWLVAQSAEPIEARHYADTGPVQEILGAAGGLRMGGQKQQPDYPPVRILGLSRGGADDASPRARLPPHRPLRHLQPLYHRLPNRSH